MVLLRLASRNCTPRKAALTRGFSSSDIPRPKHSIYVSEHMDPYFNLAFEDWLFRHHPPEQPLLLLYRDSPCVVIGRNQNPWKEINLRALRAAGIPFIRRYSGGGTVYHDLGNTNYSIHLPRTSFDRHATAQVVLKAVRSMGVDARVNDRNDVCVGKDKICSAYKIVKDRAYHHGTMLISTRLDTLGEMLRSPRDTMETRGVASVRSPVCNLQQRYPDVSHEKFVQAMVETFRQEYGVHEEAHTVKESDGYQNIEYIHHGVQSLQTWDWAFGQTPEFTYAIQKRFDWGLLVAEIKSKHGVILSCQFKQQNGGDSPLGLSSLLERLSETLVGCRYGDDDPRLLHFGREDARIGQVLTWLLNEMDCATHHEVCPSGFRHEVDR